MLLHHLLEARVQTSKTSAAMGKIVSYLEKNLNIKLRPIGVEHFKNSNGKGIGMRYVEDGAVRCFRFNWVTGKSSEIESVDVWTGNKRDPNFNISFKGVSFVKALPSLVSVLRRPKVGTFPTVGEEALTEASLGSRVKFDDYKAWKAALPKKVDLSGHELETASANTLEFSGVAGRFNHDKGEGWIYEHYLNKKNLSEAKKGEFTADAAIADMIEKMQAGRTFNRSEFVMAYHPENAHAFDSFIEAHKDELVVNGRRFGMAKGQKLGKSKGSASGEVVVAKGGTGETYESPELEKIEKEDRISFSDSLEHLEGLATALIRGSTNALFVAGRGGTGKTQTIEDTLHAAGLSDGAGFFKITGSASPIGIYTALYKNRTGIVLFDDCDGALESQDGRNIIKAATDTKKIRKIAWGKKSAGMFDPEDEPERNEPAEGESDSLDDDDDRIPRHFQFTGRVIFISNLPLNKLDPDGALRTRAFIISIDPTPDEMFQRMEEILHKIPLEHGSLSEKERKNVMAVVKTSRRAKEASLRTLVRALNLASSGAPNWEKLVQLYA